jgi:hypothetical protein
MFAVRGSFAFVWHAAAAGSSATVAAAGFAAAEFAAATESAAVVVEHRHAAVGYSFAFVAPDIFGFGSEAAGFVVVDIAVECKNLAVLEHVALCPTDSVVGMAAVQRNTLFCPGHFASAELVCSIELDVLG